MGTVPPQTRPPPGPCLRQPSRDGLHQLPMAVSDAMNVAMDEARALRGAFDALRDQVRQVESVAGDFALHGRLIAVAGAVTEHLRGSAP